MHNFNPKKRRLFVFDCDSTIIQNEVIELMAEAAGSGEIVKKVTEQAMRGEIDFEESLRLRVATLKGLGESVYQEVIDRIIYTQGVEKLFSKIHAEGDMIGIVSGGFHEILDHIAKYLEADFWAANRLETNSGFLTGMLKGQIVDSNFKARMLEKWSAENKIETANTIAVGDGANDIPMMKLSGLSVAFNAKPIVREIATYQVDRDLSQIIKLVY